MPWAPHLSQKGLVQPVKGTTIFSSPTAFSSTCMGRVHNSHFFLLLLHTLRKALSVLGLAVFWGQGEPRLKGSGEPEPHKTIRKQAKPKTHPRP